MYFSPPRKSSTCFSRTGNPLTEYDTVDEAQSSADYENGRNGCDLVPYQCQKCEKFHLKPREFFVQKLTTLCSCSGIKGNGKDAYPTRADAEKMAGIRAKAGVRLSVYECPEGNGYHLTSHPF